MNKPSAPHSSIRRGPLPDCAASDAETAPESWVEIDLAALKRNFARFARKFRDDCKIVFEVKSAGYGHGAVRAARALQGQERLAGLGVATWAEGLELRREGIDLPILVHSVLRGEELRGAIGLGMTLTVTGQADAAEAAECAAAAGRPARAHLKIDTGMGRLGLAPEQVMASIPRLIELPGFELGAVYTHLADGWADPAGARSQVEQVEEFIRGAGLGDLPYHIGGSDAVSLARGIEANRVRAGIALYGYHPGLADLEPVMTFKARVAYRRRARAGTQISYGGSATLNRDSELALVAAGYGSGYPRGVSGRAWVLIRGVRRRVLGRVCMNTIVVDVTDPPDVHPGDETVLFGRQGGAGIGADEVAAWAGTIPYETLCIAGQINPRVDRDEKP